MIGDERRRLRAQVKAEALKDVMSGAEAKDHARIVVLDEGSELVPVFAVVVEPEQPASVVIHAALRVHVEIRITTKAQADLIRTALDVAFLRRGS